MSVDYALIELFRVISLHHHPSEALIYQQNFTLEGIWYKSQFANTVENVRYGAEFCLTIIFAGSNKI